MANPTLYGYKILNSTSQTSQTLDLTTLLDPSGAALGPALAGQFTAVHIFVASNTDRNPAATGYTVFIDAYANSTTDLMLWAGYKFQPATPDTSITITGSTSSGSALIAIATVWDNVDPTTPLDGVSAVNVSSATTALPNPGSITPTTTGAVFLFGTGNASTVGTSTLSQSYMDWSVADSRDGSFDVAGLVGYKSGAVASTPYDGAALTWSGTDSTTYSSASTAIVLRPTAATSSTGASSGVGTASGLAVSIASAAGVGAASAVALAGSTASATGSGVASGLSVSIATASGVGTATGIATGVSNASASGTGSATGLSVSTASASGTGTALGVSTAAAIASASGVGTASGLSVSTASATGTGTASAQAVSVGAATGSGTAQARSVSVASSAGTGTVAGRSVSVATASGSCTVTGQAQIISVGAATGTSTASAAYVTAVDYSTGSGIWPGYRFATAFASGTREASPVTAPRYGRFTGSS